MIARTSAPFTLLLLASLGIGWAGARMGARAEDPAPATAAAPAPGAVIVLRNGQVIRGTLQLSGDSYNIDLGPGGAIRLPRHEVTMICGSLAEAYRQQLARIAPGDADARLTLATWCLHQQMFDEALQQVNVAESMNPLDNRPDPLRRRIEVARQAALTAQLEAAMPDLQAAPATYEQALPEEAALASENDDDHMATARLDQLPPGTLETFTRTIQPILLNGCAATACHGSRSESDFRLSNFDDALRFTQANTRENLGQVLRYVNREDLPASRLLAQPGTPGVCTPEGVWSGSYDARPQQVLAWLEQCYPPPEPAEAETVPSSVPRLLPSTAAAGTQPLPESGPMRSTAPGLVESPQQPRTDVTPRHMPTPAQAFAEQAAFEALTAPAEATPAQGPTRGAPPPADNVRDPFDAEIYHRRLEQRPPGTSGP